LSTPVYVTVETKTKNVGKPIKRKEDGRFLTGKANYITNLRLPNALRVGFVRSTYPHARIRKIDAGKASALKGVYAVILEKDLAAVDVPCAVRLPFARYPKYRAMAREEVNFTGEILAAVLGEDEYCVADAMELVNVEYDLLPPVTDPEIAMQDSSTRVHADLPDNLAYSTTKSFGPVEEMFARADQRFSYRIYSQRVFALPIETRAVASAFDRASAILTVWSSTQYPHLLRTFISKAIGYPEDKIRVIAPDIGGGFGLKSNIYAEEILIPLLAMKCERPVMWIEGRGESMLASAHARDARQYVDVAVRKSGEIEAMKVKLICDIGAYHHFLTPGYPMSIAFSIPEYYKIRAYEVEVNAVFTNKKSTDAYRGVIASEATFCMERVMDLVASDLGIDPSDIRLRNYIGPEEYPFTTVTGSINPVGNHPFGMKKALELLDYENFRKYQDSERSKGRFLGIGFSSYWELSGFGPPALADAFGLVHGTYESAWVRVLPTGNIALTVGSSPQGQGHETVFAQIVSDALQVDVEDVSVLSGDTMNTPYGIGTWASRSAAVGGGAVSVACEKVKQKALLIAAGLLGTKASAVVFEDSLFRDRDSTRRAVSFKEVAEEAYLGRRLPPNTEPGLEAFSYFNPSESTFASGTHAAIVEVDAESGSVMVLRYLAVNDFGNVINPIIVDGQVHGGSMQGMGQALLEKVEYDSDGQILTTNLLDYLIPTATYPLWTQTFSTAYYSTQTKANPLGVKGMGESGAIAAPAAIVNAVEDALKPFGVRIFEMPVSPQMIVRKVQENSH
jgi:aerobic carbon-monoxide dehydrogenase large subunit